MTVVAGARSEPRSTDGAVGGDPRHQAAERFLRRAGAVAIVGGPVGYVVGGLFSPVVHTSGAEIIAANVTASPATNTAHVVAFVVASYLLPLGVLALAWLAWPRAPRAAVAGGLLGVVGWVPLAALTALDDLAVVLARSPGGDDAEIYDRFSTDPVMTAYLLVYIVAHLLAYVVLGVALRRTIPSWAAWAIFSSSPLLVLAFALPGNLAAVPFVVAALSVALLVAGSVPAAVALVRARPAVAT